MKAVWNRRNNIVGMEEIPSPATPKPFALYESASDSDVSSTSTGSNAGRSRFFGKMLRLMKPNGWRSQALAGFVSQSKSPRNGRPFNTMDAGAARPLQRERQPHTEEILLGGKQNGGSHMRDAIRIAAKQLLDIEHGPAAWPVNSMPGFTRVNAGDEINAGKLPVDGLSDDHAFEQEVARLFPIDANSNNYDCQPGWRENKVREFIDLLQRGRTSDADRLSGPLERPLLMLHALAASTDGNLIRAMQVLRRLTQGFDITRPDGRPLPRSALSPETTEFLREGDDGDLLHRFFTTEEKINPSSSDDKTESLAWRTAQMLTKSSGAGFETLLAFSPVPVDASARSAVETDTQRRRRQQSLKIVLEAGSNCAYARNLFPLSALASLPVDSMERLAMQAALKLWHQPEVGKSCITPPEKAAHFNWRQGLRDPDADGDLARAQARFHKGLQWMLRAEKWGNRTLSRSADPRRLFGFDKTPFATMKVGTLGAHLDYDEKIWKKFDQPFSEAIDALLNVLNTNFEKCSSDSIAIQQALTIAKLSHWRYQTASGSAPGSCTADKRASLLILQHACARLEKAGHSNAIARLVRDAGKYRRDMLKKSYTLATLESWGRAAMDDDHAFVFRQKMNQARRAADDLVMKPEDQSISSIRAYLKKLMHVVPMGNRVRNFDGAVAGLNNTGLPFPISPDLRARRAKHAITEVNTGGHAHELFLGKQRVIQGHGGASAGVGPRLAGLVQLGAGGGGNAGGEATFLEGVRLRFLRRFDADELGTTAHREKAAQFIDRFCNQAEQMKAAKVNPQQVWQQTIVDPYFDDEDFSISWQDHRYQSSKVAAYGTAGVSVSSPAVPGAAITAAYEYNPTIGLNRSERSGRTPRTVVQMGARGKASARIGIGATLPRFTKANILSVETGFAETGRLVAIRAFEEQGRLTSNFIYKDVEYNTFDAFRSGINVNRPIWNALLGDHNLSNQLADIEAKFHPNQRPAERWRMREDAARHFDALRSILALRRNVLNTTTDPERRKALKIECKEYEAAVTGLFDDHGTWWEPVGMWNVETNEVEESCYGINFWLQLVPQRLVTADREMAWLGASTKSMNAKSNAYKAAR